MRPFEGIRVLELGQLMAGFISRSLEIHLRRPLEYLAGVPFLADDRFGRLFFPTATMLMIWLVALWMYRRRLFLRL